MKKRPDQNMVDVRALIYCEKDSHKGIIIGKHGSMLKNRHLCPSGYGTAVRLSYFPADLGKGEERLA